MTSVPVSPNSLKNLHPRPPPDLSDKIVKLTNFYYAGGGFGDVWKCLYTCPSGSKQVAVKALRFRFTVATVANEQNGIANDDKYIRIARRELGIWRRLDHKNVVPFLGVAHGFGPHVALVSLWMPHGTLQSFMATHNGKLETLHRLQLLLDVAEGLRYLHSQPFTHGDLTSNNVLIDETCSARLVDFGLASLVGETPEGLAYLHASTTRMGVARWAAPEHVSQDESTAFQRTTKSDIYSFGHIALHVLTGKEPWSEIRDEIRIILCLSRGQNPGRPLCDNIEELHWEFIQKCWLSANERPTAYEIVPMLQAFVDSQPPGTPLLQLLQPLRIEAPEAQQLDPPNPQAMDSESSQEKYSSLEDNGYDEGIDSPKVDLPQVECPEKNALPTLPLVPEHQDSSKTRPRMCGILRVARSLIGMRRLGMPRTRSSSSPDLTPPSATSTSNTHPPVTRRFHLSEWVIGKPWHRFAVVLYHPNTSMVMTLTKLLLHSPSKEHTTHATSNSTSVAALRLIEPPSDGSIIDKKDINTMEFLTKTFKPFEEFTDVTRCAALSATPHDGWALAVVSHARKYHSQLVLITWIPPSAGLTNGGAGTRSPRNPENDAGTSLMSSAEDASTLGSHFVYHVFERIRLADVAFFIDLGGNADTIDQSHILLPFFGGPDDKRALEFVLQLCMNPGVSATVITIQNQNPSSSSAEFADTRRLKKLRDVFQSEPVDYLEWLPYSMDETRDQQQLRSALARMDFIELSTSSPLHVLTQRSKQLRAMHKHLLVVCGRSRRPSGLNSSQELEQIAVDQGYTACDSVQKIIGDVATSFVIAGTQDGIVVLRAGFVGSD